MIRSGGGEVTKMGLWADGWGFYEIFIGFSHAPTLSIRNDSQVKFYDFMKLRGLLLSSLQRWAAGYAPTIELRNAARIAIMSVKETTPSHATKRNWRDKRKDVAGEFE